jgi:hypothetical protein
MPAEHYPAVNGYFRSQAFPELSQPLRPYHIVQEPSLWQQSHVFAYVASFTFSRLVEKNGRITFFTYAAMQLSYASFKASHRRA